MDQYIINYKRKPLSNLDKDIPNIIKALEIKPAIYFILSPNLYNAFNKALITKLVNYTINYALELLLISMHSDLLGFNLTKEVKSADQSEATVPMPIYQGFESYVSSY